MGAGFAAGAVGRGIDPFIVGVEYPPRGATVLPAGAGAAIGAFGATPAAAGLRIGWPVRTGMFLEGSDSGTAVGRPLESTARPSLLRVTPPPPLEYGLATPLEGTPPAFGVATPAPRDAGTGRPGAVALRGIGEAVTPLPPAAPETGRPEVGMPRDSTALPEPGLTVENPDADVGRTGIPAADRDGVIDALDSGRTSDRNVGRPPAFSTAVGR